MSSSNPVAISTGSPTEQAKKAAARKEDADMLAPAVDTTPPGSTASHCEDDLAAALDALDLKAFERELQEEEDEEERQKITRDLAGRVYFRTGKYNEKRRQMLVALGAKWEPEIKAWFVPVGHERVGELLNVYTKVLLSKSDTDALVETQLRKRKEWNAQRD